MFILRNPLDSGEFPSEVSYFRDDKAIDRDIKSPTSTVRGNVLSVLLDLLASSPYKDSKIMKQTIPCEGVCGVQLKPRPEYNQNG